MAFEEGYKTKSMNAFSVRLRQWATPGRILTQFSYVLGRAFNLFRQDQRSDGALRHSSQQHRPRLAFVLLGRFCYSQRQLATRSHYVSLNHLILYCCFFFHCYYCCCYWYYSKELASKKMEMNK